MKASRFKLFILRWLLRSKPIYDICCALRGPDQYHDITCHDHAYYGRLKQEATGIVRAAVGINPDADWTSSICITPYDCGAQVRCLVGPDASRHYIDHARQAFEALDLAFWSNNGDVRPGKRQR